MWATFRNRDDVVKMKLVWTNRLMTNTTDSTVAHQDCFKVNMPNGYLLKPRTTPLATGSANSPVLNGVFRPLLLAIGARLFKVSVITLSLSGIYLFLTSFGVFTIPLTIHVLTNFAVTALVLFNLVGVLCFPCLLPFKCFWSAAGAALSINLFAVFASPFSHVVSLLLPDDTQFFFGKSGV
jgi:hypothetical protein